MTSPSASLRRCRPLLGTFVELPVQGRDERLLERAAAAAFAAVETVQSLMSVHDPASEVSQLNRRAHRERMRISEHTWRVLAAARRISRATAGHFDVAVAPTLLRWGYLPRHAVPVRAARGRWHDIDIAEDRTVRFARPLAIDLGGIAKGYAVDCALDALDRHGIERALVNAGGDLAARGEAAHAVWIRHPHAPALLAAGELRDAAIATSSSAATRRTRGDRVVAPQVDPVRREAGLSFASVSVRAASCMMADALTKAVLAAGNHAPAWLAAFRAEALVVAHDGAIRATPGWSTSPCASA